MNKAVISKDELLTICKNIVAEKGIEAINMREVARRSKVAVGSLYNYFPSKDDLMIDTIEVIWKEIMMDLVTLDENHDFVKSVENLFYAIKNGSKKYPYFFSLHSMSVARNAKDKGREAMRIYFSSLKEKLLFTLNNDQKVKQDFFSINCSKEEFINFIFSNVIALLLNNSNSCSVLLEIIKGAIYK